MNRPVLLARIGAPHGVRGDVRVKSFTDDPMALGDYGPLSLDDGRTLTVEKIRPNKSVLVVTFREVSTREAAEALNGIDLYVDRTALPDDTEDDEFYVTDLIGLAAIGPDGTQVGRIVAVPDFGAGSLLEIAPGTAETGFSNKTWLLDFSSENVPAVDLSGGQVTIVLPGEVSERDTDTAS